VSPSGCQEEVRLPAGAVSRRKQGKNMVILKDYSIDSYVVILQKVSYLAGM
jgi:hypothetical protein